MLEAFSLNMLGFLFYFEIAADFSVILSC